MARRQGRLQPGGEPDFHSVACSIINDWQRGKLPFFVPPPQNEAEKVDWRTAGSLDTVAALAAASAAAGGAGGGDGTETRDGAAAAASAAAGNGEGMDAFEGAMAAAAKASGKGKKETEAAVVAGPSEMPEGYEEEEEGQGDDDEEEEDEEAEEEEEVAEEESETHDVADAAEDTVGGGLTAVREKPLSKRTQRLKAKFLKLEAAGLEWDDL